jgi:transcription termination/antitermination protein NusA
VIVDDTQLSLAIGRKGQNVRLAAKLLGWKIDIKSEEEKRQEVEQQMQALASVPATPIESIEDLGESVTQKLVAAGITTVEALADMTPEQLEEIPGIGEKTVERISMAVRRHFGQTEGSADAGADEMQAAAELNDAGLSADGVFVRDGDRIGEAVLGEMTESGELAGDEGVAVDNTAVQEPEIDPQDLADMLAATQGDIVDKDKEPEK